MKTSHVALRTLVLNCLDRLRLLIAIALGLLSLVGSGGVERSEQCNDIDGAKPQMARHLNAARATDRWCGQAYYAKAPALEWNNRLAQAALAHSRDMAENEHLSHVGSDGSDFVERANRAGYRGEPLGEKV